MNSTSEPLAVGPASCFASEELSDNDRCPSLVSDSSARDENAFLRGVEASGGGRESAGSARIGNPDVFSLQARVNSDDFAWSHDVRFSLEAVQTRDKYQKSGNVQTYIATSNDAQESRFH